MSPGQVFAVSAGAATEYLVDSWTTADGLPENTVRAILETRDGYLWIGTANGLARFDGVRFKRFNSANTPGLFVDDIFGLHEDRSGGIWISTRRAVFRFHEGRFETMTLPGTALMPVFGNFAEDTEGGVWMRGAAGLARWDGEKLELVSLPGDGPHTVRFLCAAPDGGLWIAADTGLWRYRGEEFEKVAVTPTPQILAAGRDGRLWGLIDELRLFVLEDGEWSEVADFGGKLCRTLYAAPDGEIWVGGASDHRAFRLRAGQLAEISSVHGLEGNRTICFAHDREGNLWIGMNGAGLYRLRERRLQLFDRKDGLRGLALASVCQDAAGTVMVNVMGWSLHRWIGNRFEPVDVAATGERFAFPTALIPAREGGVWAGTFNGTLPRILDGRIVERIGSNAGTRALFVDRDGGLWRGTRTGGVEHFSGANMTQYTTREGLSFDNVYCLAQDQGGAIWAGTEEGLNRIADGRITRFGVTNGLGHRFISALCVDSRGTLWVGTLGGGLSAWDGRRFTTLSTREGLSDDTVTQLLEDDHQHLWIGTQAGLKRVPVDQLHDFLAGRMSIITGPLIGRNEGLVRPDTWTEYQPAGIKARDGRLWFCTSSGVVVIDPRHFAEPAPPPIVHIEEVSIDGVVQSGPRKPGSEVRIPAGTERVELQYTGISPSGSELVRFRYQLKGYDRDWVEAGRARSVNYSKVRPGRYTFVVRAANNDGRWNEATDGLALFFEPAFWQTIWFRGLLVVLFLGLGPVLYLWRVRQLERRRAAQEAFSRQLIFSQEQERKRIAAELHDSLGQNLLVIKNRAALALTQQDQPDKVVAQITEVSAMASNAIREVREIAQNLRPFQLDELGLTKSIAAMVRKLADSSLIEFKTELDDIDRALPPESEINFYRVLQECMNNIVKHSQATMASITLRRTARHIHLKVVDNGQGFRPEEAIAGNGRGFGLNNIVERARTMRGEVTFNSRPGGGTSVEVMVPVD